MESARESKRKATTEAKSSSSTAPASAVMSHHPAVVKRSLVVNDDDNDNDNDVTHPAEANQKGDLDSDDHGSLPNDAVNSSGSILIMLPRSV